MEPGNQQACKPHTKSQKVTRTTMTSETPRADCRDRAFLLWDMAGTLIPFDPVTGTPGALPGCDEFLPELGQDFRLVVTTGDQTDSARNLLGGFGLLCHFEKVFGDLFSPVGKPFGEILRQMGGKPSCSMAIGDRLGADIASDTPEVITLLINQGGDTVSAGLVALVIGKLRKLSPEFPEAFALLCQQSKPDDALLGKRGQGEVVKAWRGNLGFPCQLLLFQHPVLDGDRLIIQI